MVDLRPNSSIADGVHWLKFGYMNNYIIENGDELILIDTSMNKNAKGIIKYIKKELSDKTIAKIYITHHHVDHIGGLHYLTHHFHPRVHVHEQDKPVLIGEKKAPLPNNLLLKPIAFLVFQFLKRKPINPQFIELVEDGMVSDGLQVYHLPGHTMGSVGFLKGKTFFSGDAAVTSGSKVAPGANIFAEDKELCMKSFAKLGKLEFEQILPGHGSPILEDADQRVREAIENLDQ